MLRKILVYANALADKHPALDRALQLAQHAKLELKIVDIVPSSPDQLREVGRPMRSLVEQERKDQLDALCSRLHDHHIDYTTELIRGRPFAEIVREVVHEGFHLVIKTAAGREVTGLEGMMGPVDMRLVSNCPCPVWLEVPGLDVRSERIMVAIDPQATDNELNIALLEIAESLAKAAGGELLVASAWKVADENVLAKKMTGEALEKYAADVCAAAEQCLDETMARAGNPVPRKNIHFRKGDPARTILDLVQVHEPDVLVMGTVGNADIRGLLMGNTAYSVLRQINCSVLAVKPDSLFRA